MTIVSGGQTGVDRAAWDVALEDQSEVEAATAVRAWLATVRPNVLNVAGPRASGDSAIGELAAAVLRNALDDRGQ